MNIEEALTLKSIVLYILKNGKSDASHTIYYIVKTAFVAQQRHLAKYLCPLFEDNIVALKFGPVPSCIYDALKIARGNEKTMYYHKCDNIDIISGSISFNDEFFTAKEEPDMSYLSPSAIDCLDEAIEIVSSMTFIEIVNATHSVEWSRAFNDKEDKSMSYIAIAEEGGIDQSCIPYLKENLELDCMLRQ